MYNVLRFRKVKTEQEILQMQNHNFRKSKNLKNVNYCKSEENVYLFGAPNDDLNFLFDYAKNKLIKFDYDKRQNKFCETVISASPEFFKGKTKEEQIEYFKRSEKILHKVLPGVCVVSSVIHFDEQTPHLHIIFIPTYRYKKEIKRGKDKGKIIEKIGMSYGHFFDNVPGQKNRMSIIQDQFSERLQKYYPELKRGKSKSLTNKEHLTTQQYIKELENQNDNLKNENELLKEKIDLQNEEIQILKNEIGELENYNYEISQSYNELAEKIDEQVFRDTVTRGYR